MFTMKKFLLLLFLFNTFIVYGQENIENIHWSMGNIGMGLNLLSKDREIYFNVFNLYYLNNNRSLGINFSPFLYIIGYDNNNDNIYFANLGIQYNLLSIISKYEQDEDIFVFFGPHFYINYFYFENNIFNFTNTNVNLGLKGSLSGISPGRKRYFADFLEIYIGYRFNNYENTYNRNNIYLNLHFDIINIFLSISYLLGIIEY